jgi:cell wall-associated NlpC family hydrolase
MIGAGAFAASPLALGIGLVMLVATFDDNSSAAALASSNTLRVGAGYVPAEYAAFIQAAAADCDQGLSASVLAAQLSQESGFNPRADSGQAQGIAQFTPGTWATDGQDGDGDGVKDVWNPADAIKAQGMLMCKLLKTAKAHPTYSGSPIELALAAYNAGWGAVDRFQGVPPASFAGGQTYNYVQTIMANVRKFTAPDTSGGGSVALPAGFTLPDGTPDQVRTAIAWALRQQGGDYSFGGDCTDALGGNPAHQCDCSSLVMQAYKAAGVDIPRTTFEQVKIGQTVGVDQIQPGDLVFNPGTDGSDDSPGHVAMYIGQGLLIQAPHTGAKIDLVSYASWRDSTSPLTRISAVVRVVNR